MKKKLRLLIFLCLLACLTGCKVTIGGSIEEMQSRFKVLERLYPTENVEDLFEKFPDGFSVVNLWLYNNTELRVEVKGNPDTHQVTGIIVQRPIQVEGNMPEKYKKAIYFEKGQMKMEDGSQVPKEFKDFRFLFQSFHFKESFFETASYNAKKTSYTPGTSNYFISYYAKNAELAKYLKVPEDSQLKVQFEGDLQADEEHRFTRIVDVEAVDSRKSFFEKIHAE
ncbi:hypothetical protein [Abiotrophia sp.]|uniref:hypothetical protein n=1 Tax=Abiotrophia sp. TaxID=76631 RepID=UPI001CAFAC91|nr:hypothetical protein [Abiotrophia sp.]MBF0936766.1 hypothetical protein [Abiotrophia sp.]